ncbi:GNAT family N-acetyltransferase [Streptomyces sp. NPDC058374]|uniref:GNAT family N-acetyltransferase n=1 Tax=unclassified Streptomyces TaxID=2593676 RepID=UPI0036542CC9
MDTPPADILPAGPAELRRWRSEDAEALHRAVTESRDHLAPWMPWAAGQGPRETEEYLARCDEEWETGQAYTYALTVGGEVLGSCGLMRRIGPGGLEIGYWIHPAWTGRGLVTRSVGSLVAAVRAMPDVDHVTIHHDEANQASGAVAARLGFTEISRAPKPGGPTAPGESGIEVVWRLPVPVGPEGLPQVAGG